MTFPGEPRSKSPASINLRSSWISEPWKVVFPPPTLNPLYSGGLWLPVIIASPSTGSVLAAKYVTGVGTMPTSITCRPVEVIPLQIASRNRVDDSRQSRPTTIQRPPWRRTIVPRPRPSFSTTSSVRSRSTNPRMSYSRKICGFISAPSFQELHYTPRDFGSAGRFCAGSLANDERGSAEPFANEGAQPLRIERLLQRAIGNRFEKLPGHGGEGSTGDEDHPVAGGGVALLEQLVQIDSADLRHQHIGEDQVEFSLGDQLQRLAAAVGHGDVVLAMQGPPNGGADDRLVIDDKNSS